jgi:hypothetical protein
MGIPKMMTQPSEIQNHIKKLSEELAHDIRKAREEGIKIGMGADTAAILEKLAKENMELRERLEKALSAPTDEEIWKAFRTYLDGDEPDPGEWFAFRAGFKAALGRKT